MAKYDELAERIIDKVGGRDNIAGLTHCTTKLRFRLKDDSKADTKALKTMNGVVTVLPDSMSYQVVVGFHAPEVYQSVAKTAGLSVARERKSKVRVKENLPEESIRGLLLAALGAIAAVCAVKALYSVFMTVGGWPEKSGFYTLIQHIGNSLIYILPLFLGYAVAIRLDMNKTLALMISALFLLQGYPEGWKTESVAMNSMGLYYVVPFVILPLLPVLWAAALADRKTAQIMSRVQRFILIPFVMVILGICVVWWGIRPLHNLVEAFLGGMLTFGVEAAVCAALLVLLTYRPRKEPEKKVQKDGDIVIGSKKIKSPMNGTVIPLSSVKDEAFASGLLGDGKAILPTEGKVYAPADGKITGLFMDGHAISMLTEQGIQVLIHVGINTSELLGSGFTPKVVQNEIVHKGKLLLEFDLEGMRAAGYDLTTPVIITNFDEFTEMNATEKERVKSGEDFLWVL